MNLQVRIAAVLVAHGCHLDYARIIGGIDAFW